MEEKFETLENHIVILGWSDRVKRVISELRNEVHYSANDISPVLIITATPDTRIDIAFERVYVIYGRINDHEVLKRANLEHAKALLIPTTLRDTSYSDGESVFSLLAALSVNPNIRACVEIAKADNSDTLQRIRVKNLRNDDIEIVSFESVAERLLAQAALNPGITRVYDHLLSFSPYSNEIYVLPLASDWVGTTFRRLSHECFDREVILIGYQCGEELILNPKNRDYVLGAADKVWFIAYDKFSGIKIINPQLLSK